MRASIKLISFCTILAISSVSLLINVHAQDASLTDQQVEYVRENCLSTKNTLNQLHASDALLRVNMGQVYESIATKLMDSFNSRLISNKYSSVDLISNTKSYRIMLDTFRSDYIIYEEQLTSTISVDCSKQPVNFYSAILIARNKRDQVRADVKNLNQYVEQYQSLVMQFEKDFQTKASGVNK